MCGFLFFFFFGEGGGYLIYSLTSAGRLWSGSFCGPGFRIWSHVQSL